MKKFFGSIAVFYTPRFPVIVVYMLQSTEYHPVPYLKWFWRTQNFTNVMKRRVLERTKAARLLLDVLYVGISLQIFGGLGLIYLHYSHGFAGGVPFGVALLIAYPVVWAHLIVVPLIFGRIFFITPKERRLIVESEKIFKKHKGIKLAIAGSYGKTSMKDLLFTVLTEGKKVAVTPGNKNVPISHAYFARTLLGDEDIIIIEYGEGAPGDIARFARTTHPTHGVITGLAPAHLDHYRSVAAVGKDIFSLASFLAKNHIYVNGDSPLVKPFLKKDYQLYDQTGALGWKVSNVKVSIDGVRFRIRKQSRTLTLHSQLLGRHHIGPLCLAAALAAEFGLNDEAIIKGISNTKPFEHRMQPYNLAGGWVIDDTYNGNIEGIRAGTKLLHELPAKRKIYVTPGLVDQGSETQAVHQEMGQLIAAAQPDLVVLIKNSVTSFIQTGLEAGKYTAEVRLESDPLFFYNNLAEFMSVGDIAMLQNDWTDNYN